MPDSEKIVLDTLYLANSDNTFKECVVTGNDVKFNKFEKKNKSIITEIK